MTWSLPCPILYTGRLLLAVARRPRAATTLLLQLSGTMRMLAIAHSRAPRVQYLVHIELIFMSYCQLHKMPAQCAYF